MRIWFMEEMLIGLREGIGTLYYWTWPIWPFIFVYSFTNGLVTATKNEKVSVNYFWASAISLLIILTGITSPDFH